MGSGIATPSYWSDALNADYTGNVGGGGYTNPPPTQPPVQPPTQPPVQPPTQPPVQPPTQNPYGGGFGQAWQNGDFSQMPGGLVNFYQNHGYLPPGIQKRIPEGFDYSQFGPVNTQQNPQHTMPPQSHSGGNPFAGVPGGNPGNMPGAFPAAPPSNVFGSYPGGSQSSPWASNTLGTGYPAQHGNMAGSQPNWLNRFK